jgi:uncharacterized protein (TIGR00106 family)
MLFELSLIPMTGDGHSSDEIAAALKIIHKSGLPYQLTPSATCIEGDWDEVMALIKTVHAEARKSTTHLVTTIKVEDEEGETNKISRNLATVSAKVQDSKAPPPADPVTAG